MKHVSIWILIWASQYIAVDRNEEDLANFAIHKHGQRLISVHSYETEKEAKKEFCKASQEQQKRMRIIYLPDNEEPSK